VARPEFAGRPEAERERLLLLTLERKQIVAVAYREEAVAGRVASLDVGDAARAREADLSGAGFEVTQASLIAPTEPFLALTAAPARRNSGK
jgi:hypothetical protein